VPRVLGVPKVPKVLGVPRVKGTIRKQQATSNKKLNKRKHEQIQSY